MGAFARMMFSAVVVLETAFLSAPNPVMAREFLTLQEIEKIQDAQEIEKRVKIYLDAASLRLRTARERLGGQESAPGDPLEFFTVEEMIDGYYRIMRSVMFNLDEAYQKSSTDAGKLKKALNDLKESTEKAARELEALQGTAVEKQKEELWNLVNSAIDITSGAHEGAILGLAKEPERAKSRSEPRGTK